MARVSKTNPFRPRGQPVERSNTETENKDEEKNNSSSSSSSSSNSDKNTQDKKEEKAKGKRPVQAKSRKRKTPLYEIINGLLRAKGSLTKRGRGRGRGRGKSRAYAARLWSKYQPRIDVHISSDDEPNDVDPKPKSTQDDKHEKTRGKRPMQAKGMVTKRGRGKPMAYTARLWSKHNTRSPSKKSNVDYLKVKEEDDVFSTSETDSDEVCKRINIEKHNNDDTDNNGQGTGSYTNLTSGIEVVGK